MRRWMALGGWLVVAVLGMTGCSPGRSTPRIEAIEASGGRHNSYETKLEASTNCAEIGEEVVFRTEIINRSSQPITVTGDPLIDFIVKPLKGPPAPIQRWSESNGYPNPGTTVLDPGASTAYEWQWIADAQYGNEGRFYKNGVEIFPHWVIQTNVGINGVVESPRLVVGVHAHPDLGNGGILCSRIDR